MCRICIILWEFRSLRFLYIITGGMQFKPLSALQVRGPLETLHVHEALGALHVRKRLKGC